MADLDRTAAFTAFATLGAMSTTQELAAHALAALDGPDAELVAEETLCLVAVATARAAEVGLRETPPIAEAAGAALHALPFAYRDYLAGTALLDGTPDAEAHAAMRERLARKLDFYAVHLPAGRFPGERALTDKMALWMGRISPPRQPDDPTVRLERLGLVPMLASHLKLVLALARKG